MRPSSERAKEIFIFAIEKYTPDQWEAVVTEKCEGDGELKQRVFDLLSAHLGNDSFLDQQPLTVPLVISESPGDTIGCYRLLQKIGEGGFGVVFMAEQTEPVRRKVALKVIKPGMDTKEVVARFEAERQALAIMDHQNIAKVFSAGATDSGRPYFVMELVKGVPLTDYADANNLSAEERLKLFSQICRAVHHAHQKGIIHRDLKPSNVMVTLHDGVPVPKVIDFGVSKAISQPLTEKTMFTQYGQVIGTPQYMSPEQAEMSGLDIDTRSDVYSLGVMLYELLTGQTPFTAEQIRQLGFDEMRRFIREQEPMRPSNILHTLDVDTATVVASHRSCKPDQLSKSIRGELDWIVLKALEKDRRRRYDTASRFAEDIESHLHHEPVSASPPTLAYQCWKFYQRYEYACKVASVIGALLILGIASTTMLWIKAEQRRRQVLIAMTEVEQQRRVSQQAAESERAARESAQSSLKLLIEMLSQSGTNPDTDQEYTISEALSNLATSSLLQVQTGAERELAGATLTPKAKIDLHREIGKAYLGAGKNDLAIQHLQSALDQSNEAFGAKSLRSAECLRHLGEATGSTESLRQAMDIFDLMEDRQSALTTRTSLGKLLLINGDLDSANETLIRACRDFDQLNPHVELLAIPHLLISRVYQDLGLKSEEDTYFDQAMKIAVEQHGANASEWLQQATSLYRKGRFWESEFAAMVSLKLGNIHSKYRLAFAYFENGQIERAIDYMGQAYELFATQGEAERANLRAKCLAYFYEKQGDYANAAQASANGVRWAIRIKNGDSNEAVSQLVQLSESSSNAKQIAVNLVGELRDLSPKDSAQAANLADTRGFLQLCGFEIECRDEWMPRRATGHLKDLIRRGHFDAALDFGKKSSAKLSAYDPSGHAWQWMRCSRLVYHCLDFKNAVEFQQKSIEAAKLLVNEQNTLLGWANFELAHVLYFGGEAERAKSLASETLEYIKDLNKRRDYIAHELLDPFCQWQMRVIADGKAGALRVVNEAKTTDIDALEEIGIRWMNLALGMAYEELGDLRLAIDAYDVVARLDYCWPSYPQYHFDDRLIELLERTDQLDRGKRIFTEALQTRRKNLPDRHPLIGLTQLRLADILIRAGEGSEQATDLLEKSRETMSLHQLTPQHVLDRIDRLYGQAKALCAASSQGIQDEGSN